MTDGQIAKLGLPEHLPEPVLPMITSCSPGWIKYVEHYYGDRLGHLSSCKSPHTMLGALVKSFFCGKAKHRSQEPICGLHHALYGQEV